LFPSKASAKVRDSLFTPHTSCLSFSSPLFSFVPLDDSLPSSFLAVVGDPGHLYRRPAVSSSTSPLVLLLPPDTTTAFLLPFLGSCGSLFPLVGMASEESAIRRSLFPKAAKSASPLRNRERSSQLPSPILSGRGKAFLFFLPFSGVG